MLHVVTFSRVNAVNKPTYWACVRAFTRAKSPSSKRTVSAVGSKGSENPTLEYGFLRL